MLKDTELAQDWSEQHGSPCEERASAKKALALPNQALFTICNKWALLKLYHMDNKLAINTASAHPLNLVHVLDFQAGWLLI